MKMPESKGGLGSPTLTGEYKDEDIACELCGGDDLKVLHEKVIYRTGIYLINSKKYMFHRTDVMCMKCGLVFKNPMFTEESNDKFNKEEYTAVYHGGNLGGISHSEISESIIVAAPFFRWLKKIGFDPDGLDIADIGCGMGFFLYGLRELGATVTGIDPSPRNHKIANKLFSINVVEASLFDDTEATKKNYDVVMCMNSLEHFRSPEKALYTMRGMLDFGGTLILELPAIEKPYQATAAEGFLSAAHLYTFSEYTIGELLKSTGFAVERIDFDGHQNCMYILARAVNITKLAISILPERSINEARLEELKATFKEALTLNDVGNEILRHLREDNIEKAEETFKKIPRSSNAIRANVARQLIELGKPDLALKVLVNYDTGQTESGTQNHGSFLTMGAVACIQLGDHDKAKKLLVEAMENFTPIFENPIFRNLYVDGTLGMVSFSSTDYFQCCKLLNYLR